MGAHQQALVFGVAADIAHADHRPVMFTLASGGASASLPPSGPNYPDDHTVRLWNIPTGRPITTLTGHRHTTLRLWPIDPH